MTVKSPSDRSETVPTEETRGDLDVGIEFAAAVLAGTFAAHAEDGPAKPDPFKVGGVVFMHAGTDLDEDAEKRTEFDIDRLYLTVKKGLGHNLRVRVTTDAGREKAQSVAFEDSAGGAVEADVPEDTKIRVFLKYAYLEWEPVDDVKVRFGSAGTPMPGYYDKFWGYRFVSKSFTDQFKVLHSADFGVQAVGKHAGGAVDWAASALNGEGYGSLEVDGRPTFQGRLSLDPLASTDSKLPITAFGSYGVPAPDEDPVGVFVGAAGYSMDYLTFWGEFVGRSEGEVFGKGFSATLKPEAPKVAAVFARYDFWDAEATATGDITVRVVGGIAREFHPKVLASIQYERTIESDEAGHGAFVRAQAGF